MTKLEETIQQILSERQRIANQERTQSEAERVIDQRTRQYTEEFDSLYRRIEAIEQIEKEVINWAGRCTIDDERKEIADGAGFYQHLLQNARTDYRTFREKGYEPQTAFDNSTVDLTRWIEKSTQETTGRTIYLNHSPEFLHRLRHMRDD